MEKKKIDIIKKNSKFYKLDFGIDGLDNLDKTYSLIILAVLTGFSGIDITAKEEILKTTLRAIKKAKTKAKELNIQINPNPLIFASIGMNQISNLDNNKLLEKIEFLKNDEVNIIDIHFNEIDFLSNMKKLDLICTLFKDKIISVNLSRKKLSNIHMIDLLKTCFSYSKKNLVIEVEGLRLYENSFNDILQAVSTADIINKQFIESSPKYKKIPIIFGDCKNRDIEKLAFKCDVPFNGISFFYKNIKSFFKNNYSYSIEEINLLISEIKLNYLD